MNDGRFNDGNFLIACDICSRPNMRRGCEKALYGKLGLIQLEVKKDNLFADCVPDCGAVIKVPV